MQFYNFELTDEQRAAINGEGSQNLIDAQELQLPYRTLDLQTETRLWVIENRIQEMEKAVRDIQQAIETMRAYLYRDLGDGK